MVQKSSENGEKQLYSNEAAYGSCKNCDDCTKAKDGVRRIERDMVNDKTREDAKEKAKSKEGREILKKRKSIPEPVWGNIKVQDQYTQMNYRGIEKAGLEFKMHCLMQNIRKLLKVYLNSISYPAAIHSQEGIYVQGSWLGSEVNRGVTTCDLRPPQKLAGGGRTGDVTTFSKRHFMHCIHALI